MKRKKKPALFQFISGNLALDFVNTVGNRLTSDKRRDYLQSREDFATWVKLAGLPASRREALSLQEAVRLREALYGILEARLSSQEARKHDLALLNHVLWRSRTCWRLQPENNRFCWKWANKKGICYPLARIAETAADLLLSEELRLVRQCKDEDCGWLFVDRSQGGRRKWCSMKDCGNRSKARNYLRRRR